MSFNPPFFDFCNRDDQGNLVVQVKNQGTADAPASETKVVFPGFGNGTSQMTDPLAVGDSVNLFFAIPAGCFNPDCDFTITVNGDEANPVDEDIDSDNSADGRCTG